MIRLRELSVQAFRGVPDNVTVDFSAPLTLIYAPNGSGKTTICEGVEWLLTGGIKRLEASNSSEDDIRCRFSPESTPTLVSATMEVEGETIALERKFGGCRWRLNNQPWQRVSQSDLLERLAPSAVQEGVHRTHANRSRQIWLRGTRFLSGEALATLLDSHGDSLDARQRIFADLLGVGHLLETERQLDGYMAEIVQHLRTQQSRLYDKEKEIQSRENRLGDQIGIASKDRLAAALDYVRKAYDLLGREFPADRATTNTTALSPVSSLRADLEGLKVQWNQKRQAELRIAADWPQRTALSQSMEQDQTRLITLSADEANNNNALSLATQNQQRADTEIVALRATIATLESRDRDLKDAQAQAQQLLRLYLASTGDTDLDSDTAFSIIDNEGTERARTLKLANLREISLELPIVLSQRKEIEVRKREYEMASSTAPSLDAAAQTRAALEAASQHVSALQATYDRSAGPVEQLRNLSQSVVEALGHDEHICPVCAHDWKSAVALREALTIAARTTPAQLAALGRQLRDAQTRRRAVQDQLFRENQLLASAVEREKQYRALESKLATFGSKVRQAGLDPDDPDLQNRVERQIGRVNLVPILRALRDEFHTLLSAINAIESVKTSVLQLYDQWHPTVIGLLTQAREALEVVDKRRQVAASNVTVAAETGRKIASERDEITRRVQQNASRVQALRSAWQTLAGDREWSDAALSDITSKLRTEYDAHQTVERTLAQAETLLTELALSRS
ncbi:MAG: AAA family ATPase [Alphaproteobacteria bacterium]